MYQKRPNERTPTQKSKEKGPTEIVNPKKSLRKGSTKNP